MNLQILILNQIFCLKLTSEKAHEKLNEYEALQTPFDDRNIKWQTIEKEYGFAYFKGDQWYLKLSKQIQGFKSELKIKNSLLAHLDCTSTEIEWIDINLFDGYISDLNNRESTLVSIDPIHYSSLIHFITNWKRTFIYSMN